MKRKSYRKFAILGILPAALLSASLSGCGSAKYESAADTAASASTAEAGGAWDGGIYENAIAADEAAEEVPEEPQAETVREQNRKLIKNVDMSVETEEFDALIRNVTRRVDELGGYVEQSNVYNGSYTSDYRSRSASITARIPAEKLDQFITDVAQQSNVIRKNEFVEDVTLQYVDLESHKKALTAEQESLLTMLENAESIEDIIIINEKLTDVRYQLESMESQLRTYDNKINYSTVYLDVEEVEQYEPYAAKSASERISQGFVRNLHRVGDGLEDFFIELIIALPIIVTGALILGIFVLILYFAIKAGEKHAKQRREKMAAQNPGQYNRYGMRIPVQNQAGRRPARQGSQDTARTWQDTDAHQEQPGYGGGKSGGASDVSSDQNGGKE